MATPRRTQGASSQPRRTQSASPERRTQAESIQFLPLTPARWKDVEKLFGPRGACAGCWCMWPRLIGREFARGAGPRNKRAFKRIVMAGKPPGILAYRDGEPIGWCALGPREGYVRIERSRILQRVDDRPVWSAVCFFIARPYRRQGLTVRLLREAARFAAAHGATMVEGYPVDPRSGKTADAFAWTGLAGAFREAGFAEVARRSATRPIMRLAVGRGSGRKRG